jgi:hypothetical protein
VRVADGAHPRDGGLVHADVVAVTTLMAHQRRAGAEQLVLKRKSML